MYWQEVIKRIPEEKLELLSREIDLCRDAGGDWEYESSLAEEVAGTIYTEIEVEFATYRLSPLYHAFLVNTEGGHTEQGHGQSKHGFWSAFRSALLSMGLVKIEPED